MLLSADCRDTFLCDFGLSETLDDSGRSNKAFRGESAVHRVHTRPRNFEHEGKNRFYRFNKLILLFLLREIRTFLYKRLLIMKSLICAFTSSSVIFNKKSVTEQESVSAFTSLLFIKTKNKCCKMFSEMIS